MNQEPSHRDLTEWRARFGLRTLFALAIVLVATIGATAFALKLYRALDQQAAIEEIRALGGTVYTDGNVVDRLLWQPAIGYVDLRNTGVADGDLGILQRLPPFTHL